MRDFLRQVTLFSGLNDEELELLARVASQREYPKDSYIVREDEHGISLYIIRSGTVDVVLEKSTGKSIPLSTLGSYEFFGEISLFDGKPRSATVIAREQSNIVEITRDILLTQVSKNPDIALKILAKMSQRIRNLDEIVKRFGDQIYGEVSQKVEGNLAVQLDAVKTLYEATEDRATKTLDSVEESWKRLWRLITIIIGVFTVFASAITFFGYQKYSDIKDISDMAERSGKNITTVEQNITKLEKYTLEADILREVMMNIRKIRQDLKIDLFSVQNYKPTDDELKWFGINFSRSKKELFNNYINKCEKVAPDVCLEAILTIMDLQKIDSQKKMGFQELERDEIENLTNALIVVIKKSPEKNWRMQLRARDELLKLTEKIDNLDDITMQLISLVHDIHLKDRAKYNFSLILAKLNKVDDNAKVILQWHMNYSHSGWRRIQAAIGLLQMGEANIWSNLSEIMYKKDRESFVAAFLLGQLGKQKILSLPGISTLDDNIKEELIKLIIKNIHDGERKYYANRFMKEFCDNLIKNIE